MSPQAPYLLSSGPRPGTRSSQPRFTAWLHLGISKPSTSSSHLRLLHSSGMVTLGSKQVGADPGLHHLGNRRACTPSGQLQTTSENHHPAPALLKLHTGQRLVVSGHSQSLQLTGLGKPLPLTFQQQSRIKHKRRVYSAHAEGAPHVPSLGDRSSCATGPYQIPATLGYTAKTGSQSSST